GRGRNRAVLDSYQKQLSENQAAGAKAGHGFAGALRPHETSHSLHEFAEHGVADYVNVRPMTAQLRFGVIGYGYWGPQLARNLARLPIGRVSHIAALSPERRWEAHREHPSTSVTACIEDVLASDVDAVAIATPISTHYPLARAALEHGKHV